MVPGTLLSAYDRDKASLFLRTLQPPGADKAQACIGTHGGKRTWRCGEGKCSADPTRALMPFPLPKEPSLPAHVRTLPIPSDLGQTLAIPYHLPPGRPETALAQGVWNTDTHA